MPPGRHGFVLGRDMGASIVAALIQQEALTAPLHIFRHRTPAVEGLQPGDSFLIGLARAQLLSKAVVEYGALYDKLLGKVPFTLLLWTEFLLITGWFG